MTSHTLTTNSVALKYGAGSITLDSLQNIPYIDEDDTETVKTQVLQNDHISHTTIDTHVNIEKRRVMQ